MGDFRLIAISKEKKEYFNRVFGKETIEIESPFPITGNTPQGVKRMYKPLESELTEEVKERFIDLLAEKFNASIYEVRDIVEGTESRCGSGYVISEDGTVVSVDNPLRWV